MLVEDFLGLSARHAPKRPALVCGSGLFTYGDVDESAARLAAGLQRLGVGRGDRVVLHLENGRDAVVSIFATLKAGAVVVPVNPTVKSDKLAYILNDSGAVVLITDQRPDFVTQVVPKTGDLRNVVLTRDFEPPTEWGGGVALVGLRDLLSRPGAPDPVGTIDLDLAALLYTSGSSGQPKGVMLTHANIVSATLSIHAYLQNTPADVILNVLPLSFDYGLYQVFLAFHASARLVLERSMAYPSLILDLVGRERVTALPIVPMIAALLLRYDFAEYDLSSLRYITNTGAVLPPSHIAAIRTRLPHVRLFSMYGLTECKRVSFLAPEEVDVRPTSVGKPMDNVEVYLVDEEGKRFDTGVGQLVVRGANVMQGYWNAPEETARVLQPGPLPGERVLHSGDLFRIDDEGYLYFQSRLDDVIKSRGQKVSPREIEDVIHALPGVQEVLVVGVPDPVLGEAVKAYVCLEPAASLTAQDILRHCAGHLEDFMVPRSVEIVDSLPRTVSGKAARRALKPAFAN